MVDGNAWFNGWVYILRYYWELFFGGLLGFKGHYRTKHTLTQENVAIMTEAERFNGWAAYWAL